MKKRYLHDIAIAFEAIRYNKLKSALTALGIIFGVAAVISMMAIGKGARQEILEQIKLVGVNNIVIRSLVPEKETGAGSEAKNEQKENQKFTPGLTLSDIDAIVQVLPNIRAVTPETSIHSTLMLNGRKKNAKLTGVNSLYFKLYNLELSEGSFFSPLQEEDGAPVCVIGANVKTQLFKNENPIDKMLKYGTIWLKVIGVLNKTSSQTTQENQKESVAFNDGVFVSAKTLLMRFRNRALINAKKLQQNNPSQSKNEQPQTQNFNQLDKIIVQVNEPEQLTPTANVLSRLLLRHHNNVQDFEVVVPELLLKQQQKTKDIFNIVLAIIAGISLLVGGIGIMNIMFATVMERIREIGVRLSIGAKKSDIVVQFLAEAVLISVTGGLIGVLLGILCSALIAKIAGITTILSFASVLVAFGVSVSVGIVFGFYPAKVASEKNPIESLRYE